MAARPVRNTKKDLQRQFVVARPGYTNYVGLKQQRELLGTLDDVERKVDLRTYERMEKDPAVFKCKKILITATLSDDLQMSPGASVEDVGEKEAEIYQWVCDFCERVIKGLDKPIRSTLEQIYGNSIRHGHGIAETVWEMREDEAADRPNDNPKPSGMGKPKGIKAWFGFAAEDKPEATPERPLMKGKRTRLMPKSIKVKPRGAARFVVDNFMNVLGFVPAFSDYSTTLKAGQIVDRSKFMVLTINEADEDPRGMSSYRPAFNAFNIKAQLPPEVMRFIMEELTPKAVGTLPDGASEYEQMIDANGNPVVDENGNAVMMTAVQSMLNQIEGFRSGAGAVVPFGAKLEPYKKGLTGSNDAGLYQKIYKLLNDEIETSILLQTLAQSEGEHQSRSASETVSQVLNNLIFYNRWLLSQMLTNDLLAVAIKVNLGEWALKYMPIVSLGDFVRRDWVKELEALADAYFKGFLDDSQRAELMTYMNLPKAGMSRQEQGMQALASQDLNGNSAPPPDNRPDKQEGTKDRNKGNGTEKKNER